MLSRLEFSVGLLIWCGVLWDGFATIILPRTVRPMRRLSGRFYRWSWRLWAAAGRRIRDPQSRLSFVAVYGPISIVLVLVLWAVLMIVAFALIYYPGSKEGHIPTRSASEGSGAFPSLARRVNMQQHAELPCRGNITVWGRDSRRLLERLASVRCFTRAPPLS
jgi:hypothetical protein